MAEYNQSLLYMLSGKAITSDEYKRAMTGYIPQPGDDARQLAWKADQRHSIIATAVRLGWANDPDTAKVVKDNIKANGIDLDKYDRPSHGSRSIHRQRSPTPSYRTGSIPSGRR